MPVHRGVDKKGSFYQWGNTGKKYRYTSRDHLSRDVARKKALRQGIAIRINQQVRQWH